jgi:hypothetical protein
MLQIKPHKLFLKNEKKERKTQRQLLSLNIHFFFKFIFSDHKSNRIKHIKLNEKKENKKKIKIKKIKKTTQNFLKKKNEKPVLNLSFYFSLYFEGSPPVGDP